VTVTAETLTDEEIRTEWSAALDRGDRNAAELAQVALGTWAGSHEWTCTRRNQIPACDICGGEPGARGHICRARERIATAINARKGK
jgi:hypothetical protein